MTTRLTVPDIRARKGGVPLVVLTAYSTPFAKILDPHVDILLVGDSLGMVLYGMESTLGVTLDMMIAHGRAVVKGSGSACVTVDMPFGSYQQSTAQAFENCARVLADTGCQAVKLEGGAELADTIKFLTQRGVPVMGHVGLMPQHVHAMGGFKTQGRGEESRRKILNDARAVADAGAFAMVLEGVASDVAGEVTRQVAIPVIGIGASNECDGQVLVSEDMGGLFSDYMPKFVKRYGNLAGELETAARAYAEEVRARTFPAKEHCFAPNPALVDVKKAKK